uniref:Uncharacterized protein n=1 Tax=Vespula pensylvanica TaxID=30213 RepID=A0A834NIM9_VESPE|nr:hypothetical protein H0235_014071 [Vespula pensylvanica]
MRKERRGSHLESAKFSADVARCRDTNCERYRLSKLRETVGRRVAEFRRGKFEKKKNKKTKETTTTKKKKEEEKKEEEEHEDEEDEEEVEKEMKDEKKKEKTG